MYEVSRRIILDRVLKRLSSDAASGARADVLELSYCLCSDYLSSFLFGLCNGTDYLLQNRGLIDEWRLNYEHHSCEESFFPQEMPLIYSISRSLGMNLLPKSYARSKDYLEAWMTGMAEKADHLITHRTLTGQAVSVEDEPIVYETIKTAVERDSPQLVGEAKRKEIASELFDHICMFIHGPLTMIAHPHNYTDLLL